MAKFYRPGRNGPISALPLTFPENVRKSETTICRKKIILQLQETDEPSNETHQCLPSSKRRANLILTQCSMPAHKKRLEKEENEFLLLHNLPHQPREPRPTGLEGTLTP